LLWGRLLLLCLQTKYVILQIDYYEKGIIISFGERERGYWVLEPKLLNEKQQYLLVGYLQIFKHILKSEKKQKDWNTILKLL